MTAISEVQAWRWLVLTSCDSCSGGGRFGLYMDLLSSMVFTGQSDSERGGRRVHRSLSVSLCVSVSLSESLSLCLCLSLCVSMCISVSVSLCVSVSVCVCVCVSLCLCVSVSVSVSLCVSLAMCICLCLSLPSLISLMDFCGRKAPCLLTTVKCKATPPEETSSVKACLTIGLHGCHSIIIYNISAASICTI